MVEHTIHAFDVDLQELARKIAEMGGLAEKQITDAIEALLKHNIALAKRIIAADDEVDARQREIEERAVVAIARRQPMAVDLREIVGALRICNGRMVNLVLAQLRHVLHSYAQHDLAEALDVWHRDAEIDAMNSSIFRELLTYMMENPRNITFCTHLLFCAKNIERMGDHATNIAETVYYIVKGRPLADERPKADITQ